MDTERVDLLHKIFQEDVRDISPQGVPSEPLVLLSRLFDLSVRLRALENALIQDNTPDDGFLPVDDPAQLTAEQMTSLCLSLAMKSIIEQDVFDRKSLYHQLFDSITANVYTMIINTALDSVSPLILLTRDTLIDILEVIEKILTIILEQ